MTREKIAISCLVSLLCLAFFSTRQVSARPSWHQASQRASADAADDSTAGKAGVVDKGAAPEEQSDVASEPEASSSDFDEPAANEGGHGEDATDGELSGDEMDDDTDRFDLGLETIPTSGTIKLNLDDCIRIALDHNAKIKAAALDVDAAEGQFIEAKANLWPILQYKWRVAPVPTDVDDAFNKFFDGDVTAYSGIHVGIGMPILTFGQLHMAKKLAQGGVAAARIKQRQTQSDVVYDVKQIYFGIQLAKESIKLIHEAIKQLEGKIADEEEREVPGMDPFDLLKLKSYLLELERQQDMAESNLELAYEGMRIQLDLEPGVQIELDSINLKPELASLEKLEKFVDGGMTHASKVNLLDIGVETKRRQYRLEKYKLLPRAGFGFFIDVGRSAGEIQGLKLTDDFNDPFNYTRAGLGVEVSGTIDFHGAYGRIKKARAEYHKVSYERLIARRGLRLDTRKAFMEAKRAKRNVSRTKKEESLARQMLFISKINVDVGLDNREDFAEALKTFLLARAQYFKSVFDYNMALAALEQRIGSERYHQYVPKPDIEIYDAFEYDDDDDGFITLDEEDDTYGRDTEDAGTEGTE